MDDDILCPYCDRLNEVPAGAKAFRCEYCQSLAIRTRRNRARKSGANNDPKVKLLVVLLFVVIPILLV